MPRSCGARGSPGSPAPVLVPSALVFAVSYGGFAFASAGPLLLALGIVSGLACPALASGLRVIWPTPLHDAVIAPASLGGRERTVDEPARLQTAHALDATVQQLTLG